MLHLFDRFAIFDLAQPLEAPMFEHAGMQEILVDGGQFELQRPIEKFDDLGVALHWPRSCCLRLAAWSADGVAGSNPKCEAKYQYQKYFLPSAAVRFHWQMTASVGGLGK